MVYLALLEDLVVPNPATNDTGVVDTAIIAAASIARATVQTSIATSAPENGEQLEQVVQERQLGWLGLDREFGVELALLQSVFGDGAKTRLKQKLLEAMWSQAAPKTPSESLQILEKALPYCGVQACLRELPRQVHDHGDDLGPHRGWSAALLRDSSEG